MRLDLVMAQRMISKFAPLLLHMQAVGTDPSFIDSPRWAQTKFANAQKHVISLHSHAGLTISKKITGKLTYTITDMAKAAADATEVLVLLEGFMKSAKLHAADSK
jgi:hypothetical protein